jgi:hypothetical protein
MFSRVRTHDITAKSMLIYFWTHQTVKAANLNLPQGSSELLSYEFWS